MTAQADAPGAAVQLRIRWYGGGVYELAAPDDRVIVLVDAWIWNNTGFNAFGVPKPAELQSPAAFVAHVQRRRPRAVIVALTHDHADHIGDYFELLGALRGTGIDVKTVGQSDLMRVALPPKFREANLDPAQLVLNNGAGINMDGVAVYEGVRLVLVPAVHSTFSGFPAAGFVIDIAGTRVYASGDTALFGDLALIGKRYEPALAVLATGNGAFTMGPEDAASACGLLGVAHAIPVHYAHNPLVLGPTCGETFRSAVARVAPGVSVTVLTPGAAQTLTLPSRAPVERTTAFT
jgi:L-ascorbate metabolism protein UlaG (beta-lactamase superfamily)